MTTARCWLHSVRVSLGRLRLLIVLLLLWLHCLGGLRRFPISQELSVLDATGEDPIAEAARTADEEWSAI